MQAITTRYIGARNVRGSRVKATASAGSVTLTWDDSLNSEQNHLAAAQALANKFNWHGTFIAGEVYNGATVWVCYDVNAPHKVSHFSIPAMVAA